MDVAGVRVLVTPMGALAVLAAVAAGVALGTCSGLVPGVHVNTLALLLAAAAPLAPGPPHLVGAALLAAGVTHSILDVVPMLALGVPDAALAVSALPGHRLVLGGRGREALRVSALGSATAVVVAVAFGVPATWLAVRAAPVVYAHLPVVLAVLVVVLVARERSRRARFGAVLAVAASGTLGSVALPMQPDAVVPTGDVLSPLFAGLFGAPVLLAAFQGDGIPEQADARIAVPPREVVRPGVAGSLAGAAVAYVPGVSGAIAAVFALDLTGDDSGDRAFVAALSGVNTANTVFALFALFAIGDPHTGVLVAFERARLPRTLPVLVASVVLAAVVTAAMVPAVGDRYFRAVRAVDHRRLTAGVCLLLVVVAWLFGGGTGVGLLGAATAVGAIPPVFGARRVHLMGVLLVPIALGTA
ncbi:tripartite tricarboxylate transporter permease [Halobacterium salinarum]|uniref:tripartite tricarboxylate transporter permease n=1 Tax=Halobacterium salinarum TaxID=2242 RepID=UPI001F1B6289|nr:tripartite tricarboxylate transporter permease [Halobacterium salinarum]MCF2238188.1 tripartite tricarboxylate transporter permease [Halobacterium salinarum]